MSQSSDSSRPKLSPLALVLTLSGVFFVLFIVITGGVYLARSPGGGHGAAAHGKAAGTHGKKKGFLSEDGSVGVIELNGVIMDSKKMLKKLERFADDDDIKAVVLRLNSPGGAVSPSQEIYQAVKAYEKPLVVSMSSVAASGAYYIACGAKKVYANPGTITGSIGVIMEFLNLQKLYEWARVQRYAIKTGKFKDVGAEYKEMGPEERELLQNMVNDVLSQFRQAVSEGRKLPADRVAQIADGRIFSGSQAKEAKLVDELGTLQDAINEAAKEAKIEGKPHVVYSDRPARHRVIDYLFDDRSGGGEDEESAVASDVGPASLLGRAVRAMFGPEVAADLPSTLAPGVYWLWKGAH